MKQKKCKSCGEKFTPFNSMQRTCSPKCAIDDGRKHREREFKRETRRLKEKVKSRSEWTREAQAAFNKYIRLRDSKEPCISCGRHHEGQYHAGHYRSVGSAPELRFEELNAWKQCQPCNTHLSGNLINYRINLIEKIGLERVEWLEGPHEPKKYSIDELKEIKRTYSRKARELEKLIDR